MSKQKQRAAAPQANGALLKVQDLVKFFPIKGGLLQQTVANVRAVDGVSFEIKKGDPRPHRRVGLRQVDGRAHHHAVDPAHVG